MYNIAILTYSRNKELLLSVIGWTNETENSSRYGKKNNADVSIIAICSLVKVNWKLHTQLIIDFYPTDQT